MPLIKQLADDMPAGYYWWQPFYTSHSTGKLRPSAIEIVRVGELTTWRRKPARLVVGPGWTAPLAHFIRDNPNYKLEGPIDCPLTSTKPTYDRLLLELEGVVAAFIDESPKDTRSEDAEENIQSGLAIIEKSK